MFLSEIWTSVLILTCIRCLQPVICSQPQQLDVFDLQEVNSALHQEVEILPDQEITKAEIEEAVFYMEEVLAIGNLTERCHEQYRRYKRALSLRIPWAVLMHDATGKPEAGRIDGNYYYEGDFQECDRIQEKIPHPDPVKGLYCTTLWYRLTVYMTRGRGLCLPNVCTDHDALVIAETENYLRYANENLTTDSYCAREKDVWSDPAAVASIVIVALFVIVVIVSTISDYWMDHGKNCIKRKSSYLLNIKDSNPGTGDLISVAGHSSCNQGIDNKAVTTEESLNIEPPISQDHHHQQTMSTRYMENGKHRQDIPTSSSNICTKHKVNDNPDFDTLVEPEYCVSNESCTCDNSTCTSETFDRITADNQSNDETMVRSEKLRKGGGNSNKCTVEADDKQLYSEPPVEKSRQSMRKIEMEGSTEEKRKPGKLQQLVQSFSLYKTVPYVLSAKHPRNSFRCVNAVRFLSMCWVVLGHSWTTGYYHNSIPVIRNRFVYLEFPGRLTQYVVNNVSLAVEAFFILTALLATTSFLRRVRKQCGNISGKQMIRYYIHRYWRLTPVYMLLLMVYANTFMYWGRGPFFRPHWVDTDRCKEIWWKNMLYVNNIFSPQDGECMGQSWYLANDFQFYCIAPIFFLVFLWNKFAGVLFAALGLLGSTVANVVINYQIVYGVKEKNYYYDVYVRPWTHSQTFFLGMILGYVLSEIPGKIKINKILVLLGWVMAFVLSFIAVYGQYFSSITCEGPFCGSWTEAGTVAFLSLYRPLIGCSVFWTIFACVTGNGGLINTIFSWKGWLPLARLTYVAYLLHPMLMFYLAFSRPVQFYVWDWIMVYIFCGHLTLTLAVSFIITLLMEVPFMKLERLFLPE